jgi:hypothetical protein
LEYFSHILPKKKGKTMPQTRFMIKPIQGKQVFQLFNSQVLFNHIERKFKKQERKKREEKFKIQEV